MSRNLLITILGLILLIANNNISITKGDPNTTFKSGSCNENHYGDNDPFAQLLSNVLDDLIFTAPDQADYTDYAEDSDGGESCYGYARCTNLGLLPFPCCDCLAVAAYQLRVRCPNAKGGTLVLEDCRIRYENYAF